MDFVLGASRRYSPDLRCGGGEGGKDAGSLGDLPGSKRGVDGRLGILKCLGEEPADAADRGLSVERYAGVLDNVKFMFLLFGGDCGGRIVTAGGAVESGRGRRTLVGEGDMLAEIVRGGRRPFSSTSFSLPRAALRISPKGTSSSSSLADLKMSLLPLLTLPPVGWGEMALGPRLFFDFAFAICSK